MEGTELLGKESVHTRPEQRGAGVTVTLQIPGWAGKQVAPHSAPWVRSFLTWVSIFCVAFMKNTKQQKQQNETLEKYFLPSIFFPLLSGCDVQEVILSRQ